MVSAISETWKGLAPSARAGVVGALLLIVALAAGLGFWAYRNDYQVLFSDVAPADAASMTAELERLKTPYQLADGGNTILVPKDLVYKTRLKLMGKELPLHGAVGFEVFNNADFGMTEFVQKVNYQRAIQGELTRTILSIDDIQAARVHLALPEQSLFKKTGARPKASVTVTMKTGRELNGGQIAGIQRLVAASVPEMAGADVTVLNQRGVALTRVAQAEDGGENVAAQLDSKRSTEDYLLKKVSQVLDRAYGAGQAVASVDVVLDLDQSKTTTEEVLPAKGAPADSGPAGVIVHQRESASDAGGGAAAVGQVRNGAPGSSTSESDYQVGRRVEQVVGAAGAVKRLTVAVLVKQAMSLEQQDRLKEVVASAIGVNSQRGDAVVVYSLDQLANPSVLPTPSADATPAAAASAPAQASAATTSKPANATAVALAGLLAAVVLAALAYALLGRRRPVVARLSDAQREQLLHDVRQWIGAPAAGDAMGSRK